MEQVADFGMARIVEDESGGATKSNVGPLAWMAPESISDLQYSPQSDGIIVCFIWCWLK